MIPEKEWDARLDRVGSGNPRLGLLRMMDMVEARGRGTSVTHLRALERTRKAKRQHDHWCEFGVHDDWCPPTLLQRLRRLLS